MSEQHVSVTIRAGARWRGYSMTRPRALIGLLAALAVAAPEAAAELHITHSRGVFPVRGQTPTAVVRDLLRSGPLVSGQHAFARTRMKATMEAEFRGVRGDCRVRRLRLRVSFRTLLPRAVSYRRFSPPLRREWRAFVKALRRHENKHQRIWKGCLQDADRRLRRMRASSCGSLDARVKAAFRRILGRCDARHEAFDRSERAKALRLPFVRRAYVRRRISRAE
ncbi:MAG TPA: DUF922 domain-containing protein [Thermopetrobacter sp.]|nr:DUF922 domain-containing protein [Thermopetrobacter sp.]